MTYLRLSIEPIPAGSRLASLAKLMPAGQWNRIRRAAYRRAGYRCRICGKEGQLHCHEVWQYNERTGYQWLRGFQALCRDCHDVKHILFVYSSRQRARLLRHFMTVNQLSLRQAEQYLKSTQLRQQRLNQTDWIVNYGNYNWRMPPLRSVEHRRRYIGEYP